MKVLPVNGKMLYVWLGVITGLLADTIPRGIYLKSNEKSSIRKTI